jgi:methylthioribose-1-phosphate isomerase
VANKIGTYALAILARAHEIPFYVAAPLSTFDRGTKTGAEIPIEERDASEVATLWGRCLAPQGIKVRNPAFDITPHRYVNAIVTEKGIIKPPFEKRLKQILGKDVG